jgi:hypothetical protein
MSVVENEIGFGFVVCIFRNHIYELVDSHMHAYRKCVPLIQRMDREYKFEILDTERKAAKVEGTHLSVKFQRWEAVAVEALSTSDVHNSFVTLKTEIQNCNEALFSGGGHGVQIKKLYSEFSELMRMSLKQTYYQPPLDPRHYAPIEYEPEFIKSKKEWLDCLTEIGKYIMYLEEYSVLHPRFARFRNDMLEHAASEQHEEKEPPHDEGQWPEFGDDRRLAHMSGMLCRLSNL